MPFSLQQRAAGRGLSALFRVTVSWHPGRRVGERGDYPEVREPGTLERWEIISSDAILFLLFGKISLRRAFSHVADQITLEIAGK